ncbi:MULTISPECIES: hypothetical protein [unclassified Agrobacterium]|uniref:phage head-tail joining protein n=1 Tax=unclassified Agrobacterium TaxID=2632611 RepID=UPI00244781A6|nr:MULTISPECIES: hypothetical protein [unclassified Agrobacterium]MDH0615917.1 hypothetical protein [Agrobacterium sp. GD03872]MDH0698032.1 hypothetical protein [Agrobacterium sp. GD03871]MDH1061117.1 hypothetical protein [Agrobacterium sp. GD03992]MDH2211851.1 hypothetical protein [Agrobacterium sp. GD03643]MDH2221243.1 hypothetical protein [Agrobacterium sp. GD03638]
MAFTQADLDAINNAIATGAKKVRFQTHEVEYPSVNEMLKVRQLIKDELEGTGEPDGAMFAEYRGGY